LKDSKSKFSKNLVVVFGAIVLLAIVATPALSTIFAAPGSVNTKALVKDAVTSSKIRNGTIKNADIAAGAAIAASKINLAGMVTVGGLAYKSPKTGYFTIAGSALQPYNDLVQFIKMSNIVSPRSLDAWFVAPVNLPQGAIVTEVRVKVYDHNAGPNVDIDAGLFRARDGHTAMSSASTSGGSGLWQSINDHTIDTPVIDNSTYGYEIWINTKGDAGLEHQIGLITVIYTYRSAGD